MKKIISILTIMVLLLVGLVTFSGCEDSEKESKKSSSEKDSVVTEKDDEDEDEDKKSDKDDEDEDEDKKSDKDDEDEDEDKKSDKDDEDEDEDKKSDKDDEDKDEDKDKESDSKETVNLGSKYVDLDNRSFAVNGKVYKLGVSTLQEMIDDGVPFEEDDIANANNNINKNSSSRSFKIEMGDYYTCYIYVSNFTDENKKMSECPITEISFPVRKDEKQDVITFAFPFDLTKEQLIENAGEPTKKSENTGSNGSVFTKYEYTKESTKYYGNSGYSFEYIDDELRNVRINYKE